MKGCLRCEGLTVVDKRLLEELKRADAELVAQIVEFCREHKINHRELPALTTIATCVRVIESIK